MRDPLSLLPNALADRFARDRRGAVALVFALSAVPVMLVTGMAVDYSRFASARARLQSATDAAALEAAAAMVAPSSQRSKDFVVAQVKAPAADLTVTARWASITDIRVDATLNVARGFTGMTPGGGAPAVVGSSATARVFQQTYLFQPPEITQLDPEAGDYNEISAYCYDESKKNDPTTQGRTQFTAIADNAGTDFKTKKTTTTTGKGKNKSSTTTDFPNPFPTCNANETMSYMLRNVRDARSDPSRWSGVGQEMYKYYSDTNINEQVMRQNFAYNGSKINLVETVLCNTLAACKPVSQGGVIPEGKNRQPNVETRACSDGKFMYYGYEDRPVGMGWTDEDYDDIRIIIPCPTLVKGPKEVRLTR